jgi:hypothetical protein
MGKEDYRKKIMDLEGFIVEENNKTIRVSDDQGNIVIEYIKEKTPSYSNEYPK